MKDFEFDLSFGQEPLALAHFSKDLSVIGVITLAAAFVGAATAGLPAMILIILAGLNDAKYVAKVDQNLLPGNDPKGLPLPQVEKIETPVTPVHRKPVTPPSDASPLPYQIPPEARVLEPTYQQNLAGHQSPLSEPDIALEMGRIPKSTLIAASPRVGKGVLIVKALEYIKLFHPQTEVWLLDPKLEPSESHYWQSLDANRRCHYDLRDFELDTEEAIETFSSFLIRFNQSSAKSKLLIIDEFVTLNQKLSGKFMTQLKDFLVGICSSGELVPDQGIGRFVWCISQSPYVTDLGFKTKAALTTFQRIFLLNKSSSSLYQIAASASFVPSGCEPKVNRMLERHERICYYSRLDSWQPIPNYNLPQKIADRVVRESLEASLPSFREVPGNSLEVTGSFGSNERNLEAPEAQWEVGLPGIDEWRKYFPEAPEVVEKALFFAYQRALEVEGGKKNFISQILRSGEGGRRYQAAVAYLKHLSQKFS